MELLKSINRLNMTRREKIGIGAAFAAICLFLFAHLMIFPFLDAHHRMQRALSSKTLMLQEMEKLQKEYRSAVARSRDMEKRLMARPKGFTLFSFLEEVADRAGVKGKIAYMKPSVQPLKNASLKKTSIEMKLESIASNELIDYLYHVETDDPLIRVRHLSLSKKSGLKKDMEAILQVETIEK